MMDGIARFTGIMFGISCLLTLFYWLFDKYEWFLNIFRALSFISFFFIVVVMVVAIVSAIFRRGE